MDLILIRLTTPAPTAGPSPQIVADILWATALPADRLEHIRARPGLVSGTVDVALFHSAGPDTAVEQALELCHRAIRGSPALADWTAELLQPPDVLSEIVNASRRPYETATSTGWTTPMAPPRDLRRPA